MLHFRHLGKIPIWQNSLKLWSHAINYEITPSYAHGNLAVYFNIKGRKFASAGKYQQAIVYFDKAINTTPSNYKKYLAIFFSGKGRAFANIGKYQQAADSFGHAIKH